MNWSVKSWTSCGSGVESRAMTVFWITDEFTWAVLWQSEVNSFIFSHRKQTFLHSRSMNMFTNRPSEITSGFPEILVMLIVKKWVSGIFWCLWLWETWLSQKSSHWGITRIIVLHHPSYSLVIIKHFPHDLKNHSDIHGSLWTVVMWWWRC